MVEELARMQTSILINKQVNKKQIRKWIKAMID